MLGFLAKLVFSSSARRQTAAPPKRVKAKQKVSKNTFAPSAEAAGDSTSNLQVLVANLGGDSGGKLTGHLTGHLGSFTACEVYRANQALKLGGDGDLVLKLMVAADEGRGWLMEQKADLLLWGETDGNQMMIRFLPMTPPADNSPGAFGLGDTLILPADFGPDLAKVVHVSALAAAGPTFKGSRTRIGEALGEALGSVKGLIQEAPVDLSAEQYTSVLVCIANAFAAHSLLGGGTKRLGHAVAAYKMAKQNLSPDSSPVMWAITQSHMAAALKSKGEREKDSANLKASAVAYRQISESLGRVAHPWDWALANVNLGLVLYRLAAREGKAEYLKQSTKAFEEALTVYTKEAMPARWAEVTNQYGAVLLALGEQVNGNATLEQAVKKFRTVLGTRRREAAPLQWAQTANNLGAACFSLAKRNSEAALLREASSCFEGAIEVYQQSGAAKKVEVITNNLSRVERLLSTRDG